MYFLFLQKPSSADAIESWIYLFSTFGADEINGIFFDEEGSEKDLLETVQEIGETKQNRTIRLENDEEISFKISPPAWAWPSWCAL